MTRTVTQRQVFLKDIDDTLEQLCFNIAHIEKSDSIDNIMHILYALRIAAVTYNEYELQKNFEALLAMMINHDFRHDSKTVNAFYELVETMVYPYRKSIYIAA